MSQGKSITSLVLGILSLVCGWTFFVPIIGLIFGFSGRKTEPAGRGFALAGIILNGVMLLGWILFLIIMVMIGGVTFFALL